MDLHGAKILDGPCYVKQAVHKIDRGSYTTELQLIKGAMGERPRKGAGASNTEETEGEANTGRVDGGYDTVITVHEDGYGEVWRRENNPAPTKLKGGYY